MAAAAQTPRSGRQLTLAGHGYEAVIASVGATLRTLTFDGRDLIVPFAADEVRPGYRGATLAPWPNRVVDGKYSFGGDEHQLALTEPARGHALHGLLAWTEFADRVVEDDRVVLVAVIEPQLGYPFRIEVAVEFHLDSHGLNQTVTARNIGADAAPWGTGPHPYLVAGAGRVDDWMLTLQASEVLTVTPDRLSPVAVEAIDQHPEWDFREPRRIGDVFIDHAFTEISRAEGVAEVRVVAADGRGVALSWDERCPWVQVHTADLPADAPNSRIGLAVEPMTCPPDAFNSTVDLIVLDPGAETAASWRFRAI
ncbi:aldose 1-epimerase family protein [Microbacterium sp. AK031]|uniref:aldose 1-epimerase family protein n=1 Tax=Microbacterium sp. AK031 TaxID=2723076 RepID=UPI002169C814|nr:aldose 1-epimerase family protein [Microbacterium sp. AK031]MCS3843089.1 aldose 1-epimerase [Microbacterium sp. AK031]